jgi:general secretion pathway protein J
MTGHPVDTAGRESGATLVEIVVALTVVALALAVAAGAMRLVSGSGARGAELIARHDVLSRGIDVLRRDIERLERVVRTRSTTDGPDSEFIFRGDADGLTLVVVEPAFPSDPGPYFVVYAIRQGRDGAVLTRERAPFRASTPDLRRLNTGDSAAVVEGPYRLRFLYLDSRRERERWLTHWSDPRRLPDLIGLQISPLAKGMAEMPLVVFRPRIDAERSCIKEEASACTLATGGVLSLHADQGSGG